MFIKFGISAWKLLPTRIFLPEKYTCTYVKIAYKHVKTKH